MRVYVAGPMRGLPEFNFPAFDWAATILRSHGHDVVNPAEHDRENGFNPAGMTGNEDLTEHGFDLRAALAWDLDQITRCDAVFFLDGWQQSSGARAEYALAQALGLQIASDEYWDEHDSDTWVPAATFEDDGWGLHRHAKTVTDPSAGHLQSDEIRVTDPNTGGQKGTKEVRMDLIPVYPLTELARLYGRGARKYEDNNWRKGYRWSLSYAALLRHLTQWWAGEDKDPEMGTSHLASVAWHAFTLAELERIHPGLDDRPRDPERAETGGVRQTLARVAEYHGRVFPDEALHSEAQEAGDAA